MVESILAWVGLKAGIPQWLAVILAAVIFQWITTPKTTWKAFKDFVLGFVDMGKNIPRRAKSEWARVHEKIALLDAVQSSNKEVRAAALVALKLPPDASIDAGRNAALAELKAALKTAGRVISGLVEDFWNRGIDVVFAGLPWVIRGWTAYRNRKVAK